MSQEHVLLSRGLRSVPNKNLFLCRDKNCSAVGGQVKEIDKRSLKERVGTVDLSNVEILGMDEFTLHEGHPYATIIVEPYRKEMLWIGKGRSRKSIRPFFRVTG